MFCLKRTSLRMRCWGKIKTDCAAFAHSITPSSCHSSRRPPAERKKSCSKTIARAATSCNCENSASHSECKSIRWRRRRWRRKQIDLILHRLRLAASTYTHSQPSRQRSAGHYAVLYTSLLLTALALNCIPRLIKSSGGGGCQDWNLSFKRIRARAARCECVAEMKKRLKRPNWFEEFAKVTLPPDSYTRAPFVSCLQWLIQQSQPLIISTKNRDWIYFLLT